LNYQELIHECEESGVTVEEYPLQSHDGLYCNNLILINQSLGDNTAKKCILAEELGHHFTATQNILDQSIVTNRKEERLGRIWGYNKLIGLYGIIHAYRNKCQNLYDTADYLGVTTEYLQEAISHYRSKYGVCTKIGYYLIHFEPYLEVELL
jgi:hypothetical protein